VIEPEPLQQVHRTFVRFGGRKLSYFAGCDYFRLASHPLVVKALETGATRYGLNVAASRLTTGNHFLYRQLEKALARFFAAPDALVMGSGYLTNLAAAQAFAGQFSHALLDAEAHPSLVDAARFLDCPVLRFKHRDPEDLALAVQRCGPGAKLILLTDGMFSRDGSAAPLRKYLQVLPNDALVLVDDAHGGGVLGMTGKGTLEHERISRERVIQTVTLSKAFGAFGGAILCTPAMRARIMNRSQLFAASTPIPLPIANAALTACRLLGSRKGLYETLICNAQRVKQALRAAGLDLPEAPGPIIAVSPRDARAKARIHRALLKAGIYPSFIRYPGGPETGYFRFVISSEHSQGQFDSLIKVLSAFKARLQPV
jgi:7-keto-8-aminopelargonate synthetase-like enzyme